MTCPKHPVWRLREGGACPDCLQTKLDALPAFPAFPAFPPRRDLGRRIVEAAIATLPTRKWKEHIIKIARDFGIHAALGEARIYQD